MAFGSKLEKESVFEIDGMKITVGRLDNNTRRMLDIASRDNESTVDKIKARQKIICEELIKDWKGLTEAKLSKYFVSNRTHFGSKTFDVGGDKIDIARSSIDEVVSFVLSETSMDYQSKASLAMDELLQTKDAKVLYDGKLQAMNASIREEIKNDESWHEIPSAIIEMSLSFDDFLKPSDNDGDKPLKFKHSMIVDAYCHPTRDNIIELVFDQASNNENFRIENLVKEAEDAKN